MNLDNITKDDYTKAVITLCGVAKSRTSGGRAAAQVLLSAYNGNNWQLDVTDLAVLDDDNYEAAMVLLHGRVKIRIEPHELIEDGSQVFNEIQKTWVRFHKANRWKSTCYVCDGRGVVYDEDDEYAKNPHDCESCDGSGLSNKIPEQPIFD